MIRAKRQKKCDACGFVKGIPNYKTQDGKSELFLCVACESEMFTSDCEVST